MTDNSHTHFGLPDIAMLFTSFLWGLGAVVVKSAIGDTPETFRIFVFNGIRMPVVVVLLFVGIKLSGGSIALKREHIPFIAGISFIGMFLHIVTSLIGISLSSASNMGVIFASVPLMILIVSFIMKIERPTLRLITGILIGMTGVAALSWQQDDVTFNPGDLFFIASCLFWALYTVFSRRMLDWYPPATAIAWVFFFTSIYQFPLFFYQLRDQSWSTLSSVSWLCLAIGTIGSYAVANSLYYFSLKALGPVRIGVYNNLTPVFTVTLAVLIRGENVTPLKIAGLAIILSGIAITKFPFRRSGVTKIQAAESNR